MFKTKHSLRTTVLAPEPIGVQGLSQSPKDTSQAGVAVAALKGPDASTARALA